MRLGGPPEIQNDNHSAADLALSGSVGDTL